MKKGFKILPLICWSLAILVTALVYFLLVDDLFSSAVKVLSVCFVLLAEAIMCVKFLSKKQSIIMNAQIFFGAIYLVVSFILSIIYINIPSPDVKWFIVIHAILLLLLTIVDLTVLNFHNRTESSDVKLAKNQSVIASCGILIDGIIAENTDSAFKKELLNISETIKYADNSILSGEETEIMDKLEELKEFLKSENDGEEVKTKIKNIKTLLKVRESYIKQNQRGKF